MRSSLISTAKWSRFTLRTARRSNTASPFSESRLRKQPPGLSDAVLGNANECKSPVVYIVFRVPGFAGFRVGSGLAIEGDDRFSIQGGTGLALLDSAK